MIRLSSFINDLENTAATTYKEWAWGRSTILDEVSRLCQELKKQQDRFPAILQLAKKYADIILSDISEEIQQQSSLLDSLQRRLDMAKNLHEQVVHLHSSYEVGTLYRIKKLQCMGVWPSYCHMSYLQPIVDMYPRPV